MGRDKLKSEIKSIIDKYGEEHERLRVTATRSLDELTVVFKRDNDSDINLTCTVSEEYPHVRPLWFSADEDDEMDPVCQALADLNSDEVVDENNLDKMVTYLLTRLCEAFSEAIPDNGGSGDHAKPGTSSQQQNAMVLDEEDEEDIDVLLDEVAPADDGEDGIAQEKLQKLESIRQKTQWVICWLMWSSVRLTCAFRPSQKSSVQATDRLMKDIKSIYKSDSYKNGNYTVELPDDNVYEWRVALVSRLVLIWLDYNLRDSLKSTLTRN